MLLIILQLQQILSENYPELYERLLPPMQSADMWTYQFNARIHDSNLAELYSWKNGMQIEYIQLDKHGAIINDTLPINYLFCSYGYFLKLEDAIERYNSDYFKELKDSHFFPIISNEIGDYLLINIDQNSRYYGCIFEYSPALLIIEPEVVFKNTTELLSFILDCYTEKIYTIDKVKGLIIDDDKEFILKKKYSNL